MPKSIAPGELRMDLVPWHLDASTDIRTAHVGPAEMRVLPVKMAKGEVLYCAYLFINDEDLLDSCDKNRRNPEQAMVDAHRLYNAMVQQWRRAPLIVGV